MATLPACTGGGHGPTYDPFLAQQGETLVWWGATALPVNLGQAPANAEEHTSGSQLVGWEGWAKSEPP